MHLSTTARVHQLVYEMEDLSLIQFKRPFALRPDFVCLPEFGHLTCPSMLELGLDGVNCVERSDDRSFPGSGSGCFNPVESAVSHDGASEITGETVATTVDDRDIDGAVCGALITGCHKQDRDMFKPRARIIPCEGLANIASVIHFSVQPSGDGELVGTAPGFNRPATYRDQLPMKLEHSVGPARHYRKLGTSDETLGSDAEGGFDTCPSTEQVNALWPRPGKSTPQARDIIELAERLLPESPISHLQATAIVPQGTEDAPGLFTAATRSNTLGVKAPKTGADWKAYSSTSSAVRQARMHLHNGEIHLLRPRRRKIHFDVYTDSFLRANVPGRAVKCIEKAAREVAKTFTREGLGITFVYAPGPGRKVFRICYDRNLYKPGDLHVTLAQSFFPFEQLRDPQVRLSSVAVRRINNGGCLDYMRNILEHEFTHILGFRHYNAGDDAYEKLFPSAHLPGTRNGDSDTVMCTHLHRQMRLTQKDFSAIRDIYSKPNGTLVGGLWVIRHVDPYV